MTSQPPSFTFSTLPIKAQIIIPLFSSTSSGWCPASRNVWINFGVMRCLLLPRFFFWSNWSLEKRTHVRFRRRCQKSLSKFWKYIFAANLWRPQKIDLSTVFFFEGIFWGSFLFCVWIQSREIWCGYLSWSLGNFTFQVNSDDLLRMRVVFRSMSEVKFWRGGNSDSRRVLKWILCFFLCKDAEKWW